MKKKLFFENSIDKSGEYDIVIYRNKIISYEGVSPIRSDNPSLSDNMFDKTFRKLPLNINFHLDKIDKIDRNQFKIVATHKVLCNDLMRLLNKSVYIELNFFEQFSINWYNKEYLIQSKELKIDILKYVIGAILGFILTILTQHLI